jgi:hypothetical protein
LIERRHEAAKQMNEHDLDVAPSPQDHELGSAEQLELRAFAQHARGILESWSARMTEAVLAGRGATKVARMATARAIAELRKLDLPPTIENDAASAVMRTAIEAYLKRLNSTLGRAAHEVERNRYSLDAMHAELERLDRLFATIVPS